MDAKDIVIQKSFYINVKKETKYLTDEYWIREKNSPHKFTDGNETQRDIGRLPDGSR